MTSNLLSQALVGVYLILYSIEWLALASSERSRAYFHEETVCLRLRERWWPYRPAQLAAKTVTFFGVRSIPRAMLFLGLLMSTSALVGYVPAAIPASALVLLLLFNASVAFGLSAADQMAVYVLVANVGSLACPKLSSLFKIFLVIQVTLSYGMSGLTKLRDPSWRNGDAIIQILGTKNLGLGDANWLSQRRAVAMFLSGAVITLELTWLAGFSNTGLLLFLLIATALFHAGVALTMGLNLFPWAYLSAYPLIWVTVAQLHNGGS